MNDNETRTYTVPLENVAALQDKINKLNKRANRLGCDPIKLTLGEITIVGKQREFQTDNGREYRTIRVKCRAITISGNHPKLGNYKLVARIQLIEGESFLWLVPGETLPVEYHSVKNRCDHCNVNRARNDVYVVGDKTTGDLKVVGSTCITDFLPGKTPQQLAWYAEMLASLDCREFEDFDYGSGGGANFLDVEKYLACAALAIRLDGWKSKTYVRNYYESGKHFEHGNVEATAETAAGVYWNRLGLKDGKLVEKKYATEPVQLTSADMKEMDDALAWLEALDPKENDYLINCKKVGDLSFAPWNMKGIAASIIAASQREKGNLALRKREQAESKYYGKVGDKLKKHHLTCFRILDLDTRYGTSHLHMFKDDTGNIFKWFSSNVRLEQGGNYLVSGTIKEHTEYQGVKQTMLARCKAV